MEAGNGAAGDGDEEHGEEVLTVHFKADEGGQIQRGIGGEHADDGCDHHGIEQKRAQIVAGLKQDPHGGDGGHEDVDADDIHPGGAGKVDGALEADDDARDEHDDADDGAEAEGHVLAVHAEAEDHGHEDEQQGDGGGGAVGLDVRAVGREAVEGAGHDGGKGRDDEQQRKVGEHDEQALGAHADVLGDDFAYGFALVADGGEEGAVVMHGAEEDAADNDPQKAGQPAEEGGLDGAVDGACARDGRKMMAEEYGRLGGHVVHAVLHGDGRRRPAVIHAPLFGKP